MSNTLPTYLVSDNNRLAAGFLYWYESTPDAIALNVDGISYSYRELFNKAILVYEQISELNNDLIGFVAGNGVDDYASILAISFLGAAYLPLNNKFPLERLNSIIVDSGCKCIIGTADTKLKEVLNTGIKWINNDELEATAGVNFEFNNNSKFAYVLYTSGTTGEPKGVPVSLKNVNSFFRYFQNEYDFNQHDRFLQPYELSFDVSVFSIFCAWNAGASVHVVADSNAKHLEIMRVIRNQKITVVSMVPGILELTERYFSEFNFTHVRYSFFSGDALKHTLAVRWKECIPNAALHNFYGPTETTIVCTRYDWDKSKSEMESLNDVVPLGKCFPNMEAIILSEDNKLINENEESGELCLSGVQVISNYLQNQNPEKFFSLNGRKYYRTGDLVSKNVHGNLLFHGRIDSQVKIKGYRVELIEIEEQIRKTCKINCKVIAIKDGEYNKLVAFIESKEKLDLYLPLSNVLPDFMLPSKYYFIPSFPLNINGKIDREKLMDMIQ